MAFWNRKKRGAIDAWQSETVSTEIVTGPETTISETSLVVNDEPYDPSDPTHREAMEIAEGMLGKDLDGDGRVSEGLPGAGVISDPGDDDPISRLERLQRLREQGALTDAEFEGQKRRILDSDAR